MRLFSCPACGALLYFDNTRCLTCNHELGFLPELNFLSAIEPLGNGTWRALGTRESNPVYRKCQRYANDAICNWMVPAADPNPMCRSCRMTQTIPDLSSAKSLDAWKRLEFAKRRLLYGLAALALPLVDRTQDPAAGLAFNFLADTPEQHVITGHKDGVITVNISEADPVEREKTRLKLHENYRTILGHLRHESGHYYWDRLVRSGPRLEEVRQLFGDDREDYAASMKKYYDQLPAADWSERFVSAYATMHPWEDWAETWAHYLHMVDAVEIAGNLGLSLRVRPGGQGKAFSQMTAPKETGCSFDDLLAAWIPLTFATNCLTRSIGHPDWYPFVLKDGPIAKLRLVHVIIADNRNSRDSLGTPRSAAPREATIPAESGFATAV